jgi:hypothetical protein
LILAWDSFVEGVRLLLSYSVTLHNVNISHERFREYCIGVEEIWGGQFMKPNHHHLMHMKQCVLDYGPPHVFWVFAFERSNGQLANYTSSLRTVELEMTKRFVQQQMVLNQDPASLSTLALEHASLLPALIGNSRADHHSMQLYPSDEPLPLVLQSAYNRSWYKEQTNDTYPYSRIGQPDTLAAERHAGPPEPALVQQQPQQPTASLSRWLSRWRMYSASTAAPMSGQVTAPCIQCAKLVDSISMLRSEDNKEAAVAFMPSSPRMWREFRQ